MTLIMGCGYTGRRLAGRLLEMGETVLGGVSTDESAGHLGRLGIPALVVDLDRPSVPDLPAYRAIYYLTPPPGEGHEDPRLARFLAALEKQEGPLRLVYASTTGVYGDQQGRLVNEETPLAPATDRARRRAHAEQQLADWSRTTGHQAMVLRVAGIYGPGRLPHAALDRGLPVITPEEAPYSNRIHVDDLVSTCLAAMAGGRSGRAYNVSDGAPTPMSAYYEALARLTGRPAPQRLSWDEARRVLPAGLLSFLKENRRIDSGRLRRELGVTMLHPDLESGLRASLREETAD